MMHSQENIKLYKPHSCALEQSSCAHCLCVSV